MNLGIIGLICAIYTFAGGIASIPVVEELHMPPLGCVRIIQVRVSRRA